MIEPKPIQSKRVSVFYWGLYCHGTVAGVAKRTTAPVLKTGTHTSAWVRIPFPAPFYILTNILH